MSHSPLLTLPTRHSLYISQLCSPVHSGAPHRFWPLFKQLLPNVVLPDCQIDAEFSSTHLWCVFPGSEPVCSWPALLVSALVADWPDCFLSQTPNPACEFSGVILSTPVWFISFLFLAWSPVGCIHKKMYSLLWFLVLVKKKKTPAHLSLNYRHHSSLCMSHKFVLTHLNHFGLAIKIPMSF